LASQSQVCARSLECALTDSPVADAIGNAAARALRVRIRELPFTHEQILRTVSRQAD
jgi:hypothetical protein